MGADFLREHGLLVNIKHRRLVDTTNALQAKRTISHVVSPSLSLSSQSNTSEDDALLVEFPTVTKHHSQCDTQSLIISTQQTRGPCPSSTITT